MSLSPLRFDGTVSPWPYALFRAGVAILVLLRTNDLTRSWLALDHHAWVRGLEYSPASEAIVEPALFSPLVPLVELPSPIVWVLVHARTALAILLLAGVRPRATAALLAIAGFLLMALDRHHYLHHLFLLWLSTAWLAICPSGERMSIERLFRPANDRLPRWPLELLRFQTLVIYGAAGLAKLSSEWLSGGTLAALSRAGFVEHGAELAVSWAAPLAIGVAATELALVPLLAFRRTRVAGVAIGLALHAGIDAMMMVSTFSANMMLLLLLFLPWREDETARAAAGVSREASSREAARGRE